MGAGSIRLAGYFSINSLRLEGLSNFFKLVVLAAKVLPSRHWPAMPLCDSGLDAQRQLRTRSFRVALQLYRCQSEMSVRRDLRAMLPMLAAKVYLYGAGLRFHSGLDAQRQLRSQSFRVALQLCCCQS